jgi:hypothetical protein
MATSSNLSVSSFARSSINPLPKPLKCILRTFFKPDSGFEWHSCFKAGRVSVKDDECSGRPNTSKTTENVENIRELINEVRRRTIHELADTTGISYRVWQEILTENFNMRRIAPSSRQSARPHVPENHRVCD